MARLFISHSSRDNVYALAFQNWLAANGWDRDDVFIDLHDIGAGERWRERLRRANAACEAVILLASPDSMGSIECQKELELAEALGKEIILAILRDLKTDDPLLARYSDRQFVDLSSFPQDHIEALTWKGQEYRIAFNVEALSKIKMRLDELGIAPGSFSWPPKGVAQPKPYPGLSAFEEEDAGIFFGRDADIMAALTEIRLMRRRRSPRLIVIDAASGAGKSSFLRAGLWPRLKRAPEFATLALLRPARGIISGPDGFGRRIAPFFERLGDARAPGSIRVSLLQDDEDKAGSAFASLIADAVTLAATLRQATKPDAKAPAALIAIDQAEELFQAEDDAESRRFLAILAKLLNAPPQGIDPYVILAIRADSAQSLLTRAAELHLETPKAIYLAPLSQADYREVIVRPAELYAKRVKGLKMEPALADRLIADATGADALPLLAFTLEQMFDDFNTDGDLNLKRYEERGAISGSIRRALRQAQVRAGGAGSDIHLRRLMLPRLATWDPEAAGGKGAAKRLVASFDDVAEGARQEFAPLATALVEARLLTRGHETIEVAHEALLRQPPISNWLAEDREFLIWRDRTSKARAAFEANARGPLVGRELQIARVWMETRLDGKDIPDCDRAFIDMSAAEEDQRRKEKEKNDLELALMREKTAKAAGDKAAIEKKAAEEMAAASQRVAKRTLLGLAAVFLFAVTAVWFGLEARSQWATAERERAAATQQKAIAEQQKAVAERQKRETEQQRSLAQAKSKESAERLAKFAETDARLLATQAQAQLKAGFPLEAIFLARSGLPDPRSSDIEWDARRKVPEIRDVYSSAVAHLTERTVLVGHQQAVVGTAFSPDGRRTVTASADETARLWDAETGQPIGEPLKGHEGAVSSAAFSPDGRRIVTASADTTARLWDAETGQPVGEPLRGHKGAVKRAAFSPDGRRIVTASADKTARLWDAQTGHPIGEPLKGHQGAVYSAAFSPDGRRIVTASADNMARLWDAQTSKPAGEPLKGHEDAVYSAAFSPDGRHIVTASADKTARLWDAQTGHPIGEPLKGHQGAVYSAAFSPDGRRIVTASDDMMTRLWDAETSKPAGEPLKGHEDAVYSAAFSPDGRHIVTASADNTARLWDVPQVLEGSWAAFSPDGSRIVTASFGIITTFWDMETSKSIGKPVPNLSAVTSKAVLWDIESGERIGELSGTDESRIFSAALSPDGHRIVTASDDGTARLWDAEGQPIGEPLKGHDDAVNSAAFSPDGRRIVTASDDGTARLWDAEGQPIGEPLKGHDDAVNSAAFSPDGRRIVTASDDKTARLWDAEGQPIGEPLKGHDDAVNSAAFSPDGRRIATVSDDNTARLWDAETGKAIGEPMKGHKEAVLSAAFSKDGRRIVTASADGTARLWNAETGKPVGEPMKGHKAAVFSAAFSPDGRRILTASADGTARLWNAETGEFISEPLRVDQDVVLRADFTPDGRRIVTTLLSPRLGLIQAGLSSSGTSVSPDGRRLVARYYNNAARLWDIKTGKPIREPLKGHEATVMSADFSPDGRRIVTASADTTARLWDAETGQPVGEPLRGHEGAVKRAAFSPDGRRIVTASADKTARLWDAEKGQPIGEPLKGHEGAVNSAAFSPDGRRIVTASADKTARLWDAETGKALGEPLRGHENQVNSAAFSPDGRRIVTASDDMMTRLWDAETGQPIGEPLKGHEGAVNSAAFSPDGGRILTASADNTVRLWDTRLFEKIEDLLPRCLSADQLTQLRLSTNPTWCSDKKKYPYSPAARLVSASKLIWQSDKNEAEIKQGVAELSHLIAEIELDPDQRLVLREARFLHGQANYNLKLYEDAIKDFKSAEDLGEADAQALAWMATETEAAQKIDQHDAIGGLLLAMTNHLALTPKIVGRLNPDDFRHSLSHIYALIGSLYPQAAQETQNQTECDRLASHPYDPLRKADGVDYEKISAHAAIAACDEEIAKAEGEGRFYFLRARAHSIAAKEARKSGARSLAASHHYKAKWTDLESAAARGYFFALHNLAYSYDEGEGIKKDTAKAAALFLETFNRVIACCAARVISDLLSKPGLDQHQVHRVADALLNWAAELGDPNAHSDLAKLYLAGTFPPPSGKSVAFEAYRHFKLAELLFSGQEQTEAAHAAKEKAQNVATKLTAAELAAANENNAHWAKEPFTADPPWLRNVFAAKQAVASGP